MKRTTRRLFAVVPIAGLICATLPGMPLRSTPAAPDANEDPGPGEKRDAKSLVDRGRYLVRITGCNDCHTPGYVNTAGKLPEPQWLTGDSLGFQGPWGTTYPANLRKLLQGMDVDTWLLHARRPTRPPMPWFALRDMSDEDLAAIYAFVRSLGPSAREVPAFAPPGARVRTPVVKFPGEPAAPSAVAP